MRILITMCKIVYYWALLLPLLGSAPALAAISLEDGWAAPITLENGTKVLSMALGPDGILYVGGDESVAAVGADGSLVWEVELDGGASRTMVGNDGGIYVVSNSGPASYQWTISHLSSLNGSILYTFQDSEYPIPSPALDDTGIYYSNNGRGFVKKRSLDLSSALWSRSDAEFDGTANPVIVDGNIYMSGEQKVFKGSPSSGTFSEIYSSGDGLDYLASDGKGNIFSLDKGSQSSLCMSDECRLTLVGMNASGSPLWPEVLLPGDYPNYSNGMVISKNGHIVVSLGNRLICYDAGSGDQLWSYEGPTIQTDVFNPPESFGHPVVSDGGTAYSVINGSLYIVKNGLKLGSLSHNSESIGSDFMLDADGWLFLSAGRSVYKLRVVGQDGASTGAWSMKGGSVQRTYNVGGFSGASNLMPIYSLLLDDDTGSNYTGHSLFPFADITVDGNYDDWDDVPRHAYDSYTHTTVTGSDIEYMKFAYSSDGNYLYILLKATDSISKGVVYRFFFENDTNCNIDEDNGDFQIDIETYSTGDDNDTGHDWAVTAAEYFSTYPYSKYIEVNEVLNVSGAYIEARIDAAPLNQPESLLHVFGRTMDWEPTPGINFQRYEEWGQAIYCID